MAENQISGVSMVYPNGTQALKQVDLTIPDHEFIVLLGPSGCGKSTLLRLIAGLEKPTEGALRFDGEDVSTLEPMKRNVAMVFQSFALYPHLTVYKNMAFPLKSMKLPQEEIKRRVEAAAKILDIDYLLNRRPRVLSGGQRRRWGGRWCASLSCSCSTSRCRTWTQKCGQNCAIRSSACMSG